MTLRKTKFYSNSSVPSMIEIWNNLPFDPTLCESIHCFKCCLDNCVLFFDVPFVYCMYLYSLLILFIYYILSLFFHVRLIIVCYCEVLLTVIKWVGHYQAKHSVN